MKPWESPQERSAPAWDVERLYDELGSVLTQTLTDTFGVPRDAAAVMVTDAFGASITATGDDAEAWLTATVCKSGMAYQRGLALAAMLPPDATAAEIRAVETTVFLRSTRAVLPEPAQRALHLRFHGGRSYEEIAEELGVTTHYVKRLILGGLAALRDEQRRQMPGSSE